MNRDWATRAACRNHDPDLWFPSRYVPHQCAPAKRICRTCQATKECLREALTSEHEQPGQNIHGIRAGMTPEERRQCQGM